MPNLSKAYFCPGCSGKVHPTRVVDQPDDIYQWQCNICSQRFEQPWSTAIWGNRPAVYLLNLEPWSPGGPTRVVGQECQVFPLLVVE
jgi:hypothetical protein